MEYNYRPRGVCSRQFQAEIDDTGIIKRLFIEGGCAGNSIGISQLVKGRHIDEIIDLLAGVTCGRKNTSCPDQVAKMLMAIKEEGASENQAS